MTTTEDARILAHIFECTARGMNINYERLDPLDPTGAEAQYKAVFEKLVKDIEYIKSKTRSMKWGQEIVSKLSCFSVRPEPIDGLQKNSIRGDCHGCMGCKSDEECNFQAISLFGYCEPTDESRPLFTSFEDLCDDYTVAFDAYNQVYIDGNDDRKPRKFVDGFHPQDGGMLVFGETCHNRALLYNIAHNFIFNWTFIADTYIQGMKQDGKKVKDFKLYHSLDEDAEAIRKSIGSLFELAAHETRPISQCQLSIDGAWWTCVYNMRKRSPLLNSSNQRYAKMGIRGLAPWSAPSSANPNSNPKPTPDKPPPTLYEALKEHVEQASSTHEQYGSVDPDAASSSKDSVPARVASAGPSLLSRKRKEVEPPPAAGPSLLSRKRKEIDSPPAEAAASAAAPREEKRDKLRRRLVHIKDKMVAAGRHADAVTILEAILELHC